MIPIRGQKMAETYQEAIASWKTSKFQFTKVSKDLRLQLAREDAGASLYTVIRSYYGEFSVYYEQYLEDNEEVIATDTRPGAREKAEAWASDLRDVFKELEKEIMENL